MNYHLGANTYNPRIGIAYQANPGTGIRAGYGRSFDIGVFGSIFGHAATQNLPVLEDQAVTAAGGDTAIDTAPAFQLATGPPAPVFPTVPSSGLLPDPGSSVSARSRPTTLRLPTLDAWNLSVQQSFTPTLSATIAYVGNKGTHTFRDASSNQTNPNEPGDFLPAVYSITGSPLHYDPSVDASANPQVINGQTVTGIAANGATKQTQFLQRYYGLKLPACTDANYVAGGSVRAPNGGCGWNQGIQDYSDDLDTHYNALQASVAKTFAHGFSLNANYAWQQAISFASGYSTWSRAAVRGRDSALRQQQVIVYGLLQLPFGRNKAFLSNANGIVNQLVAGWEVSPIVNYSSGCRLRLATTPALPAMCRALPATRTVIPNRSSKRIPAILAGPTGCSSSSRSSWEPAPSRPRLWTRLEAQGEIPHSDQSSSTQTSLCRFASRFPCKSGRIRSMHSITSTGALRTATSSRVARSMADHIRLVRTRGRCSSLGGCSSK